ncbi:MAG: hypothetical protein ACLSE4_10600 [Clostridium sp.]
MTWTVSTIVSEIFYCIIGLFFISNGVKALKDPDCSKNILPRCSGLSWHSPSLSELIFRAGSPAPVWS